MKWEGTSECWIFLVEVQVGTLQTVDAILFQEIENSRCHLEVFILHTFRTIELMEVMVTDCPECSNEVGVDLYRPISLYKPI